MCLLGILIILEVVSVIFTEFATRRILAGLETRLLEKLDQYGHDSTSATSFSQSLDFAQYKVTMSNFEMQNFHEKTSSILLLLIKQNGLQKRCVKS